MSEVKKLNQDEVNIVKELKEKYHQTVYEIGEIDIKIKEAKDFIDKLEVEKADLYSFFTNIKQQEIKIGKELSEKYGNGAIDLDKGEITVSN